MENHMSRPSERPALFIGGEHRRKVVQVIPINTTDPNQMVTVQARAAATFYITCWDYDGHIYVFVCLENDPYDTYEVQATCSKGSSSSVMREREYMPGKYPGFFRLNSYDRSSGVSQLSSGTWSITLTGFDRAGSSIWNSSNSFQYVMRNNLSSPSITEFNSTSGRLTVRASSGSRCYLSIEKENRPAQKNGFSIKERDYFYTAALKGCESGKYFDGVPANSFLSETAAKIRKWEYSNLRAVVVFDNYYKTSSSGSTRTTNISTATKNTCYQYAKNAISEINAMNSGLTIQLDDNYQTMDSNLVMIRGDLYDNTQKLVDKYSGSHDLIIRFGIGASMYFEDQNYNGSWQNWSWEKYPEDGIATSIANINSEVSISNGGETVNHVVHEEILQSLGAGNDSWSEPDSVFFDPPYTNPESYNSLDQSVLKQLMMTQSGWDSFDAINHLDTTCLVYAPSGTNVSFDVTKLQPGRYIATAWTTSTNSDYSIQNYSNLSQQYRFTIDSNRPARFSWTYPKTKGGNFNLTAAEWNALQDNINAVRAYRGLAPYSFQTRATPGADFSANMYKDVTAAIRAFGNGAGGYLPADHEIDTNVVITADMMNILVSELNAIP